MLFFNINPFFMTIDGLVPTNFSLQFNGKEVKPYKLEGQPIF